MKPALPSCRRVEHSSLPRSRKRRRLSVWASTANGKHDDDRTPGRSTQAYLRARRRWLDPSPELEEPSEIVSVAPGLEDLSVGNPMNEHCRERLRLAVTWDAQKTLLDAAIGRAHRHSVSLGNNVVNRPRLLYLAERAKELAEAVRTRRKSWRPALHRPGRSHHLAQCLDVVLANEIEESSSDSLVLLNRRRLYLL